MPAKLQPLPADKIAKRPLTGAQSVTIVFPWDLDATLAAFPKTPQDGHLLVLESRAKPAALPFHRQKLTLVVSALRHFVQERRDAGFHVEHRVADDYATGVTEFARWARPAELHMMEPREWAIDQRFRNMELPCPLRMHPDGGPGGHFLLTRAEFQEWAARRSQFRMHDFYVMMRRRFNLLVDTRGQPEGGKWSFDAENRQHARDVSVPAEPSIAPDALTREVMQWAERVGRWGKLEGFRWPVTRREALRWLADFVSDRFQGFGAYEDAIRSDAPFLFHSLLSAPLNLGLLHPREVWILP